MAVEWIDQALCWAYFEKFGEPIPIGPWHGQQLIEQALKEARRALEGKRGPLIDSDPSSIERFTFKRSNGVGLC